MYQNGMEIVWISIFCHHEGEDKDKNCNAYTEEFEFVGVRAQ